jgi:hypothetical protein
MLRLGSFFRDNGMLLVGTSPKTPFCSAPVKRFNFRVRLQHGERNEAGNKGWKQQLRYSLAHEEKTIPTPHYFNSADVITVYPLWPQYQGNSPRTREISRPRPQHSGCRCLPAQEFQRKPPLRALPVLRTL